MTDHHTDHFRGRHYTADHISGPVHFLNPTRRLMALDRPKPAQKQMMVEPAAAAAAPAGLDDGAAVAEAETDEVPTGPGPGPGPEDSAPELQKTASHTGVYHVWRSRDNRKGRHALALTPLAAGAEAFVSSPPPTNMWSAAAWGIGRMFCRFPVWDVSYDVAVMFTLGSVVWVLNGFFVLLPITNPASAFSGESSWGGGVSAMIGATIFELGSILLMIEAVNENRADCFGWALQEAVSHSTESVPLLLRKEENACRHHHRERSAWLSRKGFTYDGLTEGDVDGGCEVGGSGDEDGMGPEAKKRRKWTWWPSWYELRTHYFRDIGFLACLSQMFGATIFWISGFTGLPQILSVLSVPATNGIYWLPQVVGGTGFIVSSWLFMLETQRKWYIPAPKVLGWHIGLWNLIGAIGFTLCGALGFASDQEGCEIALTWSTFIGSWAFLVGSLIQWYESLDKYPISVDENVAGSRTSEDLAEKVES